MVRQEMQKVTVENTHLQQKIASLEQQVAQQESVEMVELTDVKRGKSRQKIYFVLFKPLYFHILKTEIEKRNVLEL